MKRGDLVSAKVGVTGVGGYLTLWKSSISDTVGTPVERGEMSGTLWDTQVAMVLTTPGATTQDFEVELLTSGGERGWTWGTCVKAVDDPSHKGAGGASNT